MRVIAIRRDTLAELKSEVSRPKLRELKRVMKAAEKIYAPVYFIPEYEHPAADGIPRLHIVSDQYLQKYFIIGRRIGSTSWFRIIPRRKDGVKMLIENCVL